MSSWGLVNLYRMLSSFSRVYRDSPMSDNHSSVIAAETVNVGQTNPRRCGISRGREKEKGKQGQGDSHIVREGGKLSK